MNIKDSTKAKANENIRGHNRARSAGTAYIQYNYKDLAKNNKEKDMANETKMKRPSSATTRKQEEQDYKPFNTFSKHNSVFASFKM